MIVGILVFLAMAVLIGSAFAIGGGVLLPLLLVLAGLLAVVWFAFAVGRTKRTPGELVREAPEGDFLGPGGPDDPDANR
jgi:hypothetical protein